MTRQLNRLASNAVKTLREPGRHADGGGLYLSITDGGGRSWTFLYRWRGKKTEIGLGSARDVPLARARDLATEARRHLAAGTNPRDARAAPAAVVPTFGEMAETLIETMRPSWRNPKHAAQWEMTLLGKAPSGEAAKSDYCAALRPMPVNRITTGDVHGILKNIWGAVPETAARLRGRIERVLAAAKAAGHRTGENPARWSENLKDLLPPRSKLTRGHHAAMPYASVPAFMRDLRNRRALTARALELTILTAARSNEILGATWSEFELEPRPVTVRGEDGREITIAGPCWVVPAPRMKGGRQHLVPLTSPAVALLRELQAARHGDFVFPGKKAESPLSSMALEMVLRRMKISKATPHGFRSSFRDWAAETTHFPNEVVEMALAHAIRSEVEAAYRRGSLFDKRRELMTAWADYCTI